MAKIDDSILITIRNFWDALKDRYKVDHIYLFGSYANGSFNEWSDIDLAVIVDDTDSHSRDIFSLGKEYDIRFDALGFRITDFKHSLLPIIPEIKENGIQII